MGFAYPPSFKIFSNSPGGLIYEISISNTPGEVAVCLFLHLSFIFKLSSALHLMRITVVKTPVWKPVLD
jgi:hypothetical protein